MSDHLQEGRRLAMHLPRDSVEAPRMIADALAAAETAEHDRIRKLALEPSKEMVEHTAQAIYDLDRVGVRDWPDAPLSTREDCIACARAALRAFAEEIG